jgi:hypothetical protein
MAALEVPDVCALLVRMTVQPTVRSADLEMTSDEDIIAAPVESITAYDDFFIIDENEHAPFVCITQDEAASVIAC